MLFGQETLQFLWKDMSFVFQFRSNTLFDTCMLELCSDFGNHKQQAFASKSNRDNNQINPSRFMGLVRLVDQFVFILYVPNLV